MEIKKFTPVNVNVQFSIVPDYTFIGNLSSIEKDFEIKYQGAGWYSIDSDFMLILPPPDLDLDMFRVYVWNDIDPRPLFKALSI